MTLGYWIDGCENHHKDANHTVRVMVLSRAYSLQPLIPPRVCSGSDLPFREKPAKFDNIKDVV